MPGRSGTAYPDWLKRQLPQFTAGIEQATLDPFPGYANAIRDELPDAVAVLDAFHVVKLATQVVDEVRRRIQQATVGRRGHTDDPLYKVHGLLPGCPIPEVTRLGRTLRAWKQQLLTYFATHGVSDGGTKAVNLLTEKTRRLAHGFRNFGNYRLRILLVADATRRYRQRPTRAQIRRAC